MKGLELPVNILVIIIIAIIVLLAVVALFLGGYTGVGVIDSAGAKTKACGVIVNSGCSANAWDSEVPLTGKFCGTSTCKVSDVARLVGPAARNDFYKSCGCLNGAQ
jgi:hypothetical protein